MAEKKRPTGGQRRPKQTGPSTSPSGKTIKLHQTLSDRYKARKFARSTRKAAYLSTLPKDPWKRLAYRLHPRRVAKYWFSREGAIMALKISGVGIVVVFLLIIGLFAYFRKDLPKIKDISGTQVGGSVTYYDRTGKVVLWQDYDAVKRIPVRGDQMSKYMRMATVAIEDKDFYKHGAFDIRGIMRAGVHDVFGGGGTQGGSTITQQLVKNDQGWTYNRSIARKIKEVILAVELERQYSKDDILTGYLNIAPYGNVDRGVEAAARDYFHESASDLTLAQSAMLAAIPQAPTDYSPYSSPVFNPAATANLFAANALMTRQHYILDQMAKQGMITQKEADAAKKVDILAQIKPLESKYSGIKAPYFVLTAKQDLENRLGAAAVSLGGWKVITTLDADLQDKAEKIVADNLPNIQRRTGGAADESATVVEDVKTGQIVSLVGGVDFTDPDHGQNNYASGILIPPGSSFKPYDYATFINNNNNVGAGSVLYDTQGPLPGYPCTNKALPKNGGNCLQDYDFIYPGPMPIRYALGGSRNVPAVKAMLSAVPNDTSNGKVNSINKVISTASSMMDNPNIKGSTYNCYSDEQLTQKTQCYGASAIGDGAFLHLDDHVNGLSTLARLGQAIPRTYILQVDDASGKAIYKWTQPKAKQVIKADSAYIVNDMLSDPNASYLPGSCNATTCTPLSRGGYKFQRDNGWHFAVKTGTTNDGYDGLMTSWSTKYAVVSWVGNHYRNVNLGRYGASMEQLTEPLTRGVMEAAHEGLKPVNWTAPADIKTGPVFVLRNHIHYGDIEPSPSTDLFPSWYVGGNKTSSSVTIDKVSGKVATSCTPDLAKDVQVNGNANSWNVDIFMGGHPSIGSTTSNTNGSATQAATDDVHNCNDSPPQVTITAPATCSASDNGGQGCQVIVVASQGTDPLSGGSYTADPAGTITVSLDGQNISQQSIPADSGSPYQYAFYYKPSSSGSGTMTATVVDSVLYSNTGNSNNISFSAAPAENLTLLKPKKHGNTTTFSWSGGTGSSYTVYAGTPGSGSSSAVSSNCTGQTGNSCDASNPLSGSTFFVRDNDTNTDSPAITYISGT